MISDNFTVLGSRIDQNVLDKVVSILITSDYGMLVNLGELERLRVLTVDERHAWTVGAAFTNPVQVPIEEV